MRCVRPDMTSMTMRVHYLNDGRATVAFTLRKREYFIPVALLLRVRPCLPPHASPATPGLGLGLGLAFVTVGSCLHETASAVRGTRYLAHKRDARLQAGFHVVFEADCGVCVCVCACRRWWRRRTERCTT